MYKNDIFVKKEEIIEAIRWNQNITAVYAFLKNHLDGTRFFTLSVNKRFCPAEDRSERDLECDFKAELIIDYITEKDLKEKGQVDSIKKRIIVKPNAWLVFKNKKNKELESWSYFKDYVKIKIKNKE